MYLQFFLLRIMIIGLKQSLFACLSSLSIRIAHDLYDLSETFGDLTQLTWSAGKNAVVQDDSTLGKNYPYKGCFFQTVCVKAHLYANINLSKKEKSITLARKLALLASLEPRHHWRVIENDSLLYADTSSSFFPTLCRISL